MNDTIFEFVLFLIIKNSKFKRMLQESPDDPAISRKASPIGDEGSFARTP